MTRDRDRQMSFGEWIDFKMRECGYKSDSALATELGVSHPTIGRWKRGGATPDVEQLRTLARFFRTPLPQLLVLAGHATSEEMESEAASVQSDDPVVSLIHKTSLSDERKGELLDEWSHRRDRERALMALRVQMFWEDADQDQLELYNVQEEARNQWAKAIRNLLDPPTDSRRLSDA